MSALQARDLSVAKQTSPLALRAEPDLEERLEKLVKSLGKKRHAVALACLRLGVEIVEQSPERFYDAMISGEQAKTAAALALREAELKAEQAAAKTTSAAAKNQPLAQPQKRGPKGKDSSSSETD